MPNGEYIMRNAGLEEAQAGIKIARRNINNLRYADDTTFMAESEEELKRLFPHLEGAQTEDFGTHHPPLFSHGLATLCIFLLSLYVFPLLRCCLRFLDASYGTYWATALGISVEPL